MPMNRAAADLLLDDIEGLIQHCAATLTNADFHAWFEAEAGAVNEITSRMHHDYVNERLATMLASVRKTAC